MTYKVEMVKEALLELRMNTVALDGWTFTDFLAHPFQTEDGAPIYIVVWNKP